MILETWSACPKHTPSAGGQPFRDASKFPAVTVKRDFPVGDCRYCGGPSEWTISGMDSANVSMFLGPDGPVLRGPA